jgi:hypothetical protein
MLFGVIDDSPDASGGCGNASVLWDIHDVETPVLEFSVLVYLEASQF